MVKFLEVTNSVSGKRMLLNIAQIVAITPGSYAVHKEKTTGVKIMTPTDSGCTILTNSLTDDSCGWSIKESYGSVLEALSNMEWSS